MSVSDGIADQILPGYSGGEQAQFASVQVSTGTNDETMGASAFPAPSWRQMAQTARRAEVC